jgi:CRP-like cAMP-binding protein
MPQPDAKVEALRAQPLFAGCTDRELDRLATLCDWVEAEPGAELTSEGRTGVEFFLVVEGSADVRVAGRPVARVAAGDFFGELALLEHGIPLRRATVVAAEHLGMFVFDARAFATVVESMPAVASRIRERAAARQ